ncbi:hypothetical protein FJQ87_06325 [Shewanella sp. SNU WT4]|uniref:TapY2 family type IVa secretion system protein n=1 Tax=Shewanella sp. SNU WT4 TaxID=2590015 RepID=UPI00112D6FE0|nr:TapY2 family type IVa secretion system protein [Shewanella sp. SNU WT4]QDF66364.1 hypothetical protein FJQ87_06325 [Shewanella sp. SNU WT4]
MIKYIIGFIFCTMSYISVAANIDAAEDYKCHIKVATGDKIVFYRWQSTSVNIMVGNLPGKQLRGSDGNKFFIKDVVECVQLGNDFTNEFSKQLDENTPR